MIDSKGKLVNDVLIRIGTEEDESKIKEFAERFSENSKIATEKWLRIIKEDKILPLIAEYKNLIIGKIQARIIGNIGWLESAKVSPKYRKLGIGKLLTNEAIEWLNQDNVKYIRAVVESDNLSTRNLLEKKGFKGNFLSISPSRWVHQEDSYPRDLTKFSYHLDETSYSQFADQLDLLLNGNIMIDGQYIQFNHELFEKLVKEKRILVNGKKKSFLIISTHKMPEELHVFAIGDSFGAYLDLGRAAVGLAVQEVANFVICHAPCNRVATDGLISAGLGWEQPHSNIIYQKKR